MTEPSGADALIDFWKRQVEEGTRTWLQAVEQMQGDPMQLWRPWIDQSMAAWAKMMAQGPLTPDVMAQWKQFLDQWIEAWGEALERAMGTEAFAQALGRYMDQWLNVQSQVQRAGGEAASALGALGIPTRADLVAVRRRVADLDARLDGVEDALQAIADRLDRLVAPSKGRTSTAAKRTPRRKGRT